MLAGHIRAPLAFADSSTKEALVQSLLSAAVLKSLELAGPPGRQLVDTHKAGLHVLPSGRQAKPDLVLCEGQPAIAAVSVLWEAKPDLAQDTLTSWHTTWCSEHVSCSPSSPCAECG